MAPDADVSVDLAAALVQMVELGGSDLLVKVGNRPLVRVDGQLDSLHEAGLDPVEPWETEALLHQVLPQASTTLAAMIEHINQTTRKHVVTIGEMRDEETVRTALAAAETGHLVLSTLHTLNAAESVNGRPRASGRISTTRTTTSRPAGWTRHEDLS